MQQIFLPNGLYQMFHNNEDIYLFPTMSSIMQHRAKNTQKEDVICTIRTSLKSTTLWQFNQAENKVLFKG